MKTDFKSIQARMRASFLLIICLGLCIGFVGLKELHDLAEQTKLLYEHPLTVGYAMRNIRANILQTGRVLDCMRPDASLATREKLKREVGELDVKIMADFALAEERFLGEKKDVLVVHAAYTDFKPLVSERLQLTRLIDDALVSEMHARLDAALDDLNAKSQVMIDFAAAKARSLYEAARKEEQHAQNMLIAAILVLTIASMVLAEVLTKAISGPLSHLAAAMKKIAAGDFRETIALERRDEIGVLADSFREMQIKLQTKTALAEAIAHGDFSQQIETIGPLDRLGVAMQRMTNSLRAADAANKREDWLKTGQNEGAKRIAGQISLDALAQKALSFFAEYLDVQVGALYVLTGRNFLRLVGAYAGQAPAQLAKTIEVGQGLAGQAVIERRCIVAVGAPEGYFRVSSSLGEGAPRAITAVPLVYEGLIAGVVELGSFAEFSPDALLLLQNLAEDLAVAVHTIQAQARLQELLDESRVQAIKLQEQGEELRVANEELVEHTKVLRHSEEELNLQQEELQTFNEELEEKTKFLEEQSGVIIEKNAALEIQARQLEQTSQYKSDFLANMSHELRTPLNSILILARNLGDNHKGNLTPEQVEAARIVYQCGESLLYLINDILDLSKIEAGKLRITLESVEIADLADAMFALFKSAAAAKGLDFTCDQERGLPGALSSDRHRLEQILKNLLNNAIKFTERGAVSLRFHRPDWPTAASELRDAGLDAATAIAITVADTGIGIPADMQLDIFEAFRQADGSTARSYGGTGLGLTISRELARLLGGSIHLVSEPGQGAAFSLVLPLAGPVAVPDPAPAASGPEATTAALKPNLAERRVLPPTFQTILATPTIPDDREALSGLGQALLIVEDDPTFAKILRDLCRAKGFKTLCASSGEEGVELARRYLPLALILDIKLPGISGWDVIDRLKSDPATRHVPVHVMSGLDAEIEALQRGAIGFLSKPATPEALDVALSRIGAMLEKKVKDLLVVEDDEGLRKGIIELLADGEVAVEEAADGASALEALRRKRFDCMVLDLGLPDMSGFELLRRLETEDIDPIPPIIVYTGKELTHEEEMELQRFSGSIIVKSARSEDRLLDEATLFLHRVVAAMPDKKQRILAQIIDRDQHFRGKKILAVDDDMRNLFAVAHILEQKGVNVLKAENGERALALLEEHPDVDLLLLDIMMPVMDGYETLKRLRAMPRFSRLPVIALTAKAMREDRDKCLAAGASDYLAKPLDMDRFLSMLRVWLSA